MSGDTEPVIQTVGSVDRHDQAKLSQNVTGSADKTPLKVLDNKLDNVKSKKEESRNDAVTAPRTHNEAAGPSTTSEPGVVGEIPTVGAADPGDDNTAAGGKVEMKHDEQ